VSNIDLPLCVWWRPTHIAFVFALVSFSHCSPSVASISGLALYGCPSVFPSAYVIRLVLILFFVVVFCFVFGFHLFHSIIWNTFENIVSTKIMNSNIHGHR
jgi:hypothetical protein